MKQIKEIEKLIDHDDYSVILCGDFNAPIFTFENSLTKLKNASIHVDYRTEFDSNEYLYNDAVDLILCSDHFEISKDFESFKVCEKCKTHDEKLEYIMLKYGSDHIPTVSKIIPKKK